MKEKTTNVNKNEKVQKALRMKGKVQKELRITKKSTKEL